MKRFAKIMFLVLVSEAKRYFRESWQFVAGIFSFPFAMLVGLLLPADKREDMLGKIFHHLGHFGGRFSPETWMKIGMTYTSGGWSVAATSTNIKRFCGPRAEEQARYLFDNVDSWGWLINADGDIVKSRCPVHGFHGKNEECTITPEELQALTNPIVEQPK